MKDDLNVLLVDPGFFPTHEREGFLTKYVDLDSQIQTKPPLGTLALASFLNERDFNKVRIMDVEAEKIDSNKLQNYLRDFHPDVVGLTAYTYRLKNVFAFIHELKDWNPLVHICVGGPHTLIYPKETLQLEGVDSIVVGDGELPFFRLCEGLLAGESFPEAQGLFHSSKVRSYQTFGRNTEKSMDMLPFPNPNLINNFQIKYKNILNNKATMTFVSSKGCPYQCNFCIAPSIPYRAMGVERLIEAVKYYTSLGFKEIDFYDDTFNVNLKKLEDFATYIIEENLLFRWSVRGAKVRNMGVPFLKLLKKSGLIRMQFGVESGSSKVLGILNKNYKIEEAIMCFYNLRAAGIDTIANIMIFCPGETHEDTMETVKLINRIRPSFISVQVFVIFPPMKWYYELIKEGKIHRDLWYDYVTNPTGEVPTLTIRGEGNADDLFEYRNKIVKEYYFTPKYITNRLAKMRFGEIKAHAKIGFMLVKNYFR